MTANWRDGDVDSDTDTSGYMTTREAKIESVIQMLRDARDVSVDSGASDSTATNAYWRGYLEGIIEGTILALSDVVSTDETGDA